ncbi:unnamed protein product [Triticum turgidum subsp. durum]|uniref:Endonuclease/exonuclease/phosphatase domain-containing protein n=1 Tax=Triticum turgidum subsp. durum TaxID=4567 RepID=A0A9R0SIX8_TRITD|nr:unnamed protein product [Triticum turgidum subsp. durum]
MKRFFQPVLKDGSPAKKRPAGAAISDCVDGRAPTAADAGGDGPPGEEPRRFITWNANSLLLRMKSDWPAFCQFVARLDPDVICVQEVRMPAAGSKGAPKNPSELKDDTTSSREEKQTVLRALSSSPFKDYRVWWSLSDSKYAGTAVFMKKKFEPKKVSFNLDRTSSTPISHSRTQEEQLKVYSWKHGNGVAHPREQDHPLMKQQGSTDVTSISSDGDHDD